MSDSLAKLAEKARQVRQYIPATELPSEVEALMVSDLVFKTDKRGNECCFVTLMTKDRKYIVQKYTPTTYSHLHNAIKACGGIEALQKDFHTWRKARVGRIMNERLFPVPKSAPAPAEAEVEAEVVLEPKRRPKKKD